MKAVLIVGDGMADRPIKDLGMRTPLQVAAKPNMDRLASKGISGIMDPISPGIPAGSDTSHLSLFGYDPYKCNCDRGPFEALGAGMEMVPGDIAFRCNFGTVDKNLIVRDRRAGRIIEQAGSLAESLNLIRLDEYPDITVNFKHTTEHRCVLILKGPSLSSKVSDNDPRHDNVPLPKIEPTDGTVEAAHTADVANQLTEVFYNVLDNHPQNMIRRIEGNPPANIVLLRGAGTLSKDLVKFDRKYGVTAAAIGANALIIGVCRAVGMDCMKIAGATGTIETDAVAKAKGALEALKSHDFVYVHVKATDNASHDHKGEDKIKAIEKIDGLVGYLLDHLDFEDTVVSLTADHTTSVKIGEHTGDPVPISIMGEGVRSDGMKGFSELESYKGGLGRIRGLDLMPILVDLMGRSKKFGA